MPKIVEFGIKLKLTFLFCKWRTTKTSWESSIGARSPQSPPWNGPELYPQIFVRVTKNRWGGQKYVKNPQCDTLNNGFIVHFVVIVIGNLVHGQYKIKF